MYEDKWGEPKANGSDDHFTSFLWIGSWVNKLQVIPQKFYLYVDDEVLTQSSTGCVSKMHEIFICVGKFYVVTNHRLRLLWVQTQQCCY